VAAAEEIKMMLVPVRLLRQACMPLLLASLAATACGPGPAPSPATTAPEVAAPEVAATRVPALTGLLTRPQLQAYDGWQTLLAEDYTPGTEPVESLRTRAGTFSVLLFVGSWCPDCKREVPRLWKIADQAGLPGSTFEIHGLDRTKTDDEGLTARWDVHFVPTAIVLRDNRELGRIVERPTLTLEDDLVTILDGNVVEPAPADGGIGSCDIGASCRVN
jgi:thiol-disulfide isomerase/thioredoxin